VTGGQAALCGAAVAVAAAAVGWGLGRGGGGETAGELSALRNEVSALRAELAAARADTGSGDAAYVAMEKARYKATLARQRFAIDGAMADERDPAELDAMQRALGTIDAVEHQLQQVQTPEALAKWFDTTNAIRQRWPAKHAWLLPDLKWR
jgi:hypothetical protein